MPNIKRGMMGAAGVSTDAPDVPGTLWSWGRNTYGEAGIGSVVVNSSPVQVGSLETWLVGTNSVAASNRMFVKGDNTLWAWGKNDSGQLGLSDAIYRSSPVQVGSLTDWAFVQSDGGSAAAIKTDGTLWTWGSNSAGKLGRLSYGGIGWGKASSSPVQVGSLTDWSTLTFASQCILAIKTDGTLWAWGSGSNGKLGVGSTISYSSPIQVGGLTTWANITGGDSHVLGITTGGTLFAWGKNTDGQLGLGDVVLRSSPVQVGSLATWASASLDGRGTRMSSALTTTGKIYTWGKNNNGQLGLGDTVYRSSPVQVGSVDTWKKISAGSHIAGAIKEDGTLWTWGRGLLGGLAHSTTIISCSAPTQVGSSTDWISIGMGDSSGIATRTP